jgi:type II secretory pathway component PulC
MNFPVQKSLIVPSILVHSDKYLIGLSFVFFLYISYSLFIQKPENTAMAAESLPVPAIQELVSAASYESYDQIFQNRDLFAPIPERIKTQEIGQLAVAFTQDLKVVGTILGHPSEVIIENQQSKETFFLKLGDHLKEATIQKIVEGKVLLQYRGKVIEMAQP